MSWNNVMPAWVILGDRVIHDYQKGKLSYELAKEKLESLGCPESMITRLGDKPREG